MKAGMELSIWVKHLTRVEIKGPELKTKTEKYNRSRICYKEKVDGDEMEICGKQQTRKCEKVKREETEQAENKIAYEWKSHNLIGTVSPRRGRH
jgi:hypothetical protein